MTQPRFFDHHPEDIEVFEPWQALEVMRELDVLDRKQAVTLNIALFNWVPMVYRRKNDIEGILVLQTICGLAAVIAKGTVLSEFGITWKTLSDLLEGLRAQLASLKRTDLDEFFTRHKSTLFPVIPETGIAQSKLGETLGWSTSITSRTLQACEARGIITRTTIEKDCWVTRY